MLIEKNNMDTINKNINLKLLSNIDIRNRQVVSAININELEDILPYADDIKTKKLLEKLICECGRQLNSNKHLKLDLNDSECNYIRIIRKEKPTEIISNCFALENGIPWLWESKKLMSFEKKKITKYHED